MLIIEDRCNGQNKHKSMLPTVNIIVTQRKTIEQNENQLPADPTIWLHIQLFSLMLLNFEFSLGSELLLGRMLDKLVEIDLFQLFWYESSEF